MNAKLARGPPTAQGLKGALAGYSGKGRGLLDMSPLVSCVIDLKAISASKVPPKHSKTASSGFPIIGRLPVTVDGELNGDLTADDSVELRRP